MSTEDDERRWQQRGDGSCDDGASSVMTSFEVSMRIEIVAVKEIARRDAER